MDTCSKKTAPQSKNRRTAREVKWDIGSRVLWMLFAALCGSIVGLMMGLNEIISSSIGVYSVPPEQRVRVLAVAAFLGGVGAIAVRAALVRVVRRLSDDAASVRVFGRKHALTYGVFLLLALGSEGWPEGSALNKIVLCLFAVVNGLAVFATLRQHRRARIVGSTTWLTALFFFSGMAALIYQVTWQRALFTCFGVNIESVTIIVSIFMLGLGLGSLLGGRLSKRPRGELPLLFFGCEFVCGLFGLGSLPLIRGLGTALSTAPLPVVSVAVFAILLIPTLLMGATFPLLVQFVHGTHQSFRRTVATLYFVNTLGSAFACVWTSDVLFVIGGQKAAVVFAALCNFAVGLLVLDFARRNRGSGSSKELESAPSTDGLPVAPDAPGERPS